MPPLREKRTYLSRIRQSIEKKKDHNRENTEIKVKLIQEERVGITKIKEEGEGNREPPSETNSQQKREK